MAKSKKKHPDEAEDKELFSKLFAKKLGKGKKSTKGDKADKKTAKRARK